jgi:uncharacterized protein (DUF1800 family)
MPPLPVRRVFVSALPLVAALGLAACASGKTKTTSLDRAFASRLAQNDAAVVHLLNRATFGVRRTDVDEVRRTGIVAFLDRQLHPEQIDDGALQRRLAAFETLNLTSQQIAEQYYQPAQQLRRKRQMEAQGAAGPAGGALAQVGPARAGTAPAPPSAADQELFRKERVVLQELSGQKILRAVYSERQLQEVLVEFWFNHFNVFAGKGADRGLLTAYERDVIRPRVFGKFRDLLGATAESPAMLFFLDNWMSVDPNGPHAIGGAVGARHAVPLPPQGRGAIQPRRGGGAAGMPRVAAPPTKPARGLNENYARELMELHTLGVDSGYTQKDVVEVARCFTGWTIAQPRDGGDFTFDPRQHDPGQKTVLGHVIRAGGGRDDGDQVLDVLAHDPHTAHFVATKLTRRFVADDPPAALVERVARRFRETDGDLREVYRTIFMSDEFWSAEAFASKVKTPLEFVASALRATSAQIDDATSSVQALRSLGMPPYFCQPPTGYADRSNGWVNTGALLNRVNFALALVDSRLPGVRVDLAALAGSPDLAAARSQLLRQLLDTNVSPATLATLNKASTVPQLVALALGAPEFQKK